jgi:thiol-disulfide isomerase/thioredoxin
MNPASDETPLLLACLCADWCGTCRDYRALFAALQAEFGAAAAFAWVDIEDDDEALGTVEVDDFPTLLIARGEQIVFFGTVMPHLQTARRLLLGALDGSLRGTPATDDARLAGLPARLRALAG